MVHRMVKIGISERIAFERVVNFPGEKNICFGAKSLFYPESKTHALAKEISVILLYPLSPQAVSNIPSSQFH